MQLAQLAASGRTLGSCEVCLSDDPPSSAGNPPSCYAHLVMERCYAKSWSISGDAGDRPTEEVAFYYNKIAFAFESNSAEESMSWDNEKNKPWPEGLDWLFPGR